MSSKIAVIRIDNLSLRTIIGINDWERKNKQDILINIEMEFDAAAATASDQVEDTLNYRTVAKQIIKHVEESNYFLLEKLTDSILQIIMKEGRVIKARVRVDKPHALRFSQSVSIELSAQK